MPGRMVAKQPNQPMAPRGVQDPVSADTRIQLVFLAVVAMSVYGTAMIGDLLAAQGAGRRTNIPTPVLGDAAPNTSRSVATSPSLIPDATAGNGVIGLAGAPDYVVAAIPFFIAMMVVEWLCIKATNFRSVAAQYEMIDTWAGMTCGLTQALMAMLFRPIWPMTFVYCYLFDHFRVSDVFADNDSWVVSALAFVAGDFAYYWYHRNAHEVHFLWAGHHVHHSSEHYNLSTALRQSWQQAMLSGCWSLPMALLFPPRAYMVAQHWVTLYQFWVHTCVIRRLPDIVEYWMVTPSGHRMHHDRRLHKNFAGVFIIWDRLFGTFQDELLDTVPVGESRGHLDARPPPVAATGGEEIAMFGITDRIRSWADSTIQHLIWRKIWYRAKVHPWKALSDVWYGPGWTTSTARRPIPDVAPADMLRLRIDNSHIPHVTQVLVFACHVWSLFGFVSVLIRGSSLSVADTTLGLCFVLLSATNQGLLLDQWRYAITSNLLQCLLAIVLPLPIDYAAEAHVVLGATVIVLRSVLVPAARPMRPRGWPFKGD